MHRTTTDLLRERLELKRAALARGVEGVDIVRADACPTCGAFLWWFQRPGEHSGTWERDHDPERHGVEQSVTRATPRDGAASTPAIDLDAIRRRREANDDDE